MHEACENLAINFYNSWPNEIDRYVYEASSLKIDKINGHNRGMRIMPIFRGKARLKRGFVIHVVDQVEESRRICD